MNKVKLTPMRSTQEIIDDFDRTDPQFWRFFRLMLIVQLTYKTKKP